MDNTIEETLAANGYSKDKIWLIANQITAEVINENPLPEDLVSEHYFSIGCAAAIVTILIDNIEKNKESILSKCLKSEEEI